MGSGSAPPYSVLPAWFQFANLSPETGSALLGEVCPRSPLEGLDEPGTGLAQCPQPGPDQGWDQRGAPAVSTRLVQSQLEVVLQVLAPQATVERGSPAWAQILPPLLPS